MKLKMHSNILTYFVVLLLVLNANSETIVTNTQANPLSQPSPLPSSQTQSLDIKLEREPIYAYPGIITDFIITPPIQRNQNEIQNLFRLEFSDSKYLPPRIYFSRGDRNDQIRVMFDYQNDIPFRPFSVKFLIKDDRYQQLLPSSITLVYDSISGGISSALFENQGQKNILR